MAVSESRAALSKIAKHTMVQGEIVHAANLLHSAFFLTFLIAIGLGRSKHSGDILGFLDHANSMWHVIQSDSAQRDLAFNAIATVHSQRSLEPAISRMKWAVSQAGRLGKARNIVAHVPVGFAVFVNRGKIELAPEFGSLSARPQHKKVLREIQGLRFWQQVRNDLLKLHEYVSDVNAQTLNMAGLMGPGVLHTWPRRPLLQSVSRLQEIDNRSRVAPKTKRRVRRQTSRR